MQNRAYNNLRGKALAPPELIKALLDKVLWLNDGSCIMMRPELKDHVWRYDFMVARMPEGKAFRILTILDEYIRECLVIMVNRNIS